MSKITFGEGAPKISVWGLYTGFEWQLAPIPIQGSGFVLLTGYNLVGRTA